MMRKRLIGQFVKSEKFENLFYVDWLNNVIGEIDDVHSTANRRDFIDYSAASVSPAGIQWLPG